MKILIVEDDQRLAEMLHRTLAIGDQTEILIVESLVGAIELNRTFQPNLTILDLMLTDATPTKSTQAIPQLIQENPNGAVIVYSGMITDELKNQALTFGAKLVKEKGVASTSKEILQAATDALCTSGTCQSFLAHIRAVLTNKPIEQ